MSVFQVTPVGSTMRKTIVATNVVDVDETSFGAVIHLIDGRTVPVKESYRSVRGYLKKALAPASKDAE